MSRGKMTTVINVTNALWYIAETAVPEATRIRVYDFGYNNNTTCQIEGGGSISSAITHIYARDGTAIVYVPLGTVKRNNVYIPDNEAFKVGSVLVATSSLLIYLLGKK